MAGWMDSLDSYQLFKNFAFILGQPQNSCSLVVQSNLALSYLLGSKLIFST